MTSPPHDGSRLAARAPLHGGPGVQGLPTRLVGRHRVLTTDQLAALRFSNLTTARHRLVRLGVLRRFRPRRETGSAPWHYVVGPVGAAMFGQEDRDERKRLPQVWVDRQLALKRSHSREHGGGELLRWDSERETAAYLDHYPDGLGIWAEENRDIAFLVKFDTGTEHLPQLTGKLTGYAEKARMPGGLVFRMAVLFCFPAPRRKQTARKALAATTASLDLQIATAALDPRLTCPACETTWMPLHGRHHSMRLIDLDDTPRSLAHRTRATRTRTPRAGPGALMTLHAAHGAPADGSPGIPHPPDETSPDMPLTPQAPGEADQPSREPDPPGQEAGDLCSSQEPESVSREQGLRAWAAALAAELPPLTSSQAAAVARIAARLDARNGQEPAA